jgi:hypothetical protein
MGKILSQRRVDGTMKETINMFACTCSAQSEGKGDPPKCWSCAKQMYLWSKRTPQMFSTVLDGDAADRRNASGGYT